MTTFAPGIVETLTRIVGAVPGQKITLEQLMDGIGQRSFGVLLLVLGVPCLLPVLGIISLFGIILLMLGVQMMLGFHQPWLPSRIRHTALSKAQLLKVLGYLAPLNKLNPYIHRRLPGLVRSKGERFAGLMVVLQAVFIIIPLPLTNEPPAFSLVLLALAFIQQDGALALIAYALGVLGMGGMLLAYAGLISAGYQAWLAWL